MNTKVKNYIRDARILKENGSDTMDKMTKLLIMKTLHTDNSLAMRIDGHNADIKLPTDINEVIIMISLMLGGLEKFYDIEDLLKDIEYVVKLNQDLGIKENMHEFVPDEDSDIDVMDQIKEFKKQKEEELEQRRSAKVTDNKNVH